ncbi:MAG: aldo/keto reductase [Mycolicibacterium cosmeticum]|nr:aldo/keto reductase [Mycolicibacterium cosmeticum]
MQAGRVGRVVDFDGRRDERPQRLELTEPRADGMLLAGRYPILDHETALQRLMPLATENNSGALVGGAHFEYGAIPPEIAERVTRISALCDKHDVPIKAAALHFSLAHPAVVAVVPGSSRPDRIAEDVAAMEFTVPGAFWQELRDSGVVSAAAPVPGDG